MKLVFEGNLSDQFCCSGKIHKFVKIEKKTAGINSNFFVFQIRIPPDSLSAFGY